MPSRGKPRSDLTFVPQSLDTDAAPSVLQSMVEWLTDLTWYPFDCNMDHVNAAWTRVYAEIEEVGLAYEPAEEFVTWYAATQPCEDFAETFRTYLRFRKNLDRFRSRPGVYRKLKAVEQAVGQAREELGLG